MASSSGAVSVSAGGYSPAYRVRVRVPGTPPPVRVGPCARRNETPECVHVNLDVVVEAHARLASASDSGSTLDTWVPDLLRTFSQDFSDVQCLGPMDAVTQRLLPLKRLRWTTSLWVPYSSRETH